MNIHFIVQLSIIPDHRLQNVHIGLANVDPQNDPPNLTNYKLCTYYGGIVVKAATQAFYCDNGGVLGRYLIVQTDLNPYEPLSLCEVEAFECK